MSLEKTPQSPATTAAPLSRRTLFAGAGAVGAVAAVAAVTRLPSAAAPVAQAVLPEAEAGGYQLTDHVKRYYQTARV